MSQEQMHAKRKRKGKCIILNGIVYYETFIVSMEFTDGGLNQKKDRGVR